MTQGNRDWKDNMMLRIAHGVTVLIFAVAAVIVVLILIKVVAGLIG